MREFWRLITLIVLTSIVLFVYVIVGTAAIINLPQTGQVTCYNSSGTAIACAGTGQDGDIRAGVPWPVPRFVDNSDGTISDTLTGLMWLKDADCFYRASSGLYGAPWRDVLTKVADFNAHPGNYTCANYTANYNDWRLPNIIELESLPSGEVQYIATWLNALGFANVNPNTIGFWSSTNPPAPYGGMYAWLSHGWGRFIFYEVSSDSVNLLPVRLGQQGSPDPNYSANTWRTGQTVCYDASNAVVNCPGTGQDGDTLRGVTWPDPRFTDNSNGTVTDNLTGLIWLKDITCLGWPTWQGALNNVADFNSSPGNFTCEDYTASLSDWRLPNRKELLSLIDFSQMSPAFPPGFSSIFAHIDTYEVWSSTSSTPATFGASAAWIMSLQTGVMGPYGKTGDGILAWAVRGGPTGSANFADISVTKTDSPDPVVVNQPLVYTITVTNNGPDQGNGVSLTDNLPTGVTFVSASSDQGTCSQLNGIVTCTIGSITNSAHATVTINVLAPSQSGTFANSASVTSTSVDLYSANDTATVYTTVSGPVNLPQTGQTTSYHSGDDGAIRAGVAVPNPRFTITYCNTSGPCPNQASDCDSNASTDLITDNLTGLVWARDGNIANLNPGGQWIYAMQYTDTINAGNGLCGYKDWRIPNVNELASLKISLSLNSQGFVKITGNDYWSATTSASDTTYALVSYSQYLSRALKSDFWYHQFIPVRGGTNLPAQVWRTGQTTSYYAGDDGALKTGIPWPATRFANTNGTTPVTGDVVLDNLTGLMWTKNANLPNAQFTWNGGLDYITNMNSGAGYGGYTDWRFPNYIELRSLWDLSQDPALPSGNPFVNLNNIYWSSSTDSSTNEAFCVGFGNSLAGMIGVNGKTETRWIWPVRGGFITPPSSSSLYADFAGAGVYQYNGSTWTQVTPYSPTAMTASGSLLYGKYDNGIWQYNGSTWTQLTPYSPTAMAASSSLLYGKYDNGIWLYNGSSWSQLTPYSPTTMVATGSLLYGKYDNGIWQYNGSVWTQLTPYSPTDMVATGSLLYGKYPNGIWQYNGSTWTQLTPYSPTDMVATGSLLYGKYDNGIWLYNGSTWSQVTPNNPEAMVATGSLLYGDFGSTGIWMYNGSTWSQITPNNPATMIVP